MEADPVLDLTNVRPLVVEFRLLHDGNGSAPFAHKVDVFDAVRKASDVTAETLPERIEGWRAAMGLPAVPAWQVVNAYRAVLKAWREYMYEIKD